MVSGTYSVRWSPDGLTLAAACAGISIELFNNEAKKTGELRGHTGLIHCLQWTPDGRVLVSSAVDKTIRLWDIQTQKQIAALEGHTQEVYEIAVSFDGSLIASNSRDGTTRIWQTSTGSEVTKVGWDKPGFFLNGLAFHPKLHVLAVSRSDNNAVIVWDLDPAVLLGDQPASEIVRYTSAKVVFIGESNVGKSCLAMRLAEGRYPRDEEHGSTHGMRFWKMEPEQLSERAKAPEGQRRDVVLWDLGGQEEYRLVHQLFLHDTTLALVLVDPTRGQTAFEEVEAWVKRLDKQLGARRAAKVLVGAKLDEQSDVVDAAALERLRGGVRLRRLRGDEREERARHR